MTDNPNHTGDPRPFTDSYPPLRDWLRKHNARCMWQVPLGPKRKPTAYVESWILPAGKADFVIVIRANGMGWEIYTPERSNQIVATFADAETRLGLPRHNHPDNQICAFGCRRYSSRALPPQCSG